VYDVLRLEFTGWTREYPELVAFGSMNMGLYSGIKMVSSINCSTGNVTLKLFELKALLL
jgi:hypothetical protein